jgi:hypothetical protein
MRWAERSLMVWPRPPRLEKCLDVAESLPDRTGAPPLPGRTLAILNCFIGLRAALGSTVPSLHRASRAAFSCSSPQLALASPKNLSVPSSFILTLILFWCILFSLTGEASRWHTAIAMSLPGKKLARDGEAYGFRIPSPTRRGGSPLSQRERAAFLS